MSQNNPKVSIGLPVYNGENYVGEAIESVLSQSYDDFELIVTDNSSTDQTEEICRSYAAKDKRIRYFRNEKNLGASRNFNKTVELARGDYFKWAAHDDTISHDYLSKCVEVLEKDPTIVLCYTKIKIIDEFNSEISDYKVEMKNANSFKPHKRFRDLILISHWGIEVFGLFRTSELRKTKLIDSFPGSDRTLMAEISLLGRLYQIPEYLFFSRDHSDRSVRNGTVHSRAEWFDTSKSNQTVFPHWRVLQEFCRTIDSSPLTKREKTYCYLSLGRLLTVNYNFARLLIDLAMAVEPRTWDWVMKLRGLIKKNQIKTKRIEDKLLSSKSKS